jgi:hypothetical protein
MKKLIYSILSLAVLLISACSKEDELDNSVYVPDPVYRDLPAYTEWGYNTFGAYFDRELFIYNDAVPAKVINTNGTTSLMLKGAKNYSTDMSLTFGLSGFSAQVYTDLAQLNDTVFNLADTSNHVIIKINNTATRLKVMNGELQFKRAQLLYIDDVPSRVILSGYFHLQALIDSEPVSIYSGRFDVGIADRVNFYSY